MTVLSHKDCTSYLVWRWLFQDELDIVILGFSFNTILSSRVRVCLHALQCRYMFNLWATNIIVGKSVHYHQTRQFFASDQSPKPVVRFCMNNIPPFVLLRWESSFNFNLLLQIPIVLYHGTQPAWLYLWAALLHPQLWSCGVPFHAVHPTTLFRSHLSLSWNEKGFRDS